MKARPFFARVLLPLAFAQLAIAQSQMPPAPKGYTWKACPAIKGALLVPDGWHFKAVQSKSTKAYFVTKQNIDAKGKFETGVTMNVMLNIKAKSGLAPSEWARQYMAQVPEKLTVEKTWTNDMGPFKGLGCIGTERTGENPLKIHTLLIANDKTGTLYLVLFETPAKHWARDWPVVEPVLKRFMIDDEI